MSPSARAHGSQLRLLQLASQALPTGAFAYSSGLESALSLGWLEGEADCTEFVGSLMDTVLARLELPLFLGMYSAVLAQDPGQVRRLSQYLLASRESRELQEQDGQMARALGRVLAELLAESDRPPSTCVTFSEALAWATVAFELDVDQARQLLVYTWLEPQVSALSRLIPLGPLGSQRMMDRLLKRSPEAIAASARVTPEQIGASAPRLALASCLHETQYSRIFRS